MVLIGLIKKSCLCVLMALLMWAMPSLANTKNCDGILNGSHSLNWLQQNHLFMLVRMQRFENGISVQDPRRPAAVWLTNEWLQTMQRKFNWVPNEPAKTISAFTYTYGKGLGSGRDYILDRHQALGVKGAGTNAFFPPLEFQARNFRRNGLLSLEDASLDYYHYKLFDSLGIPTVPILDFVLLPRAMQTRNILSGIPGVPIDLSAQLIRKLDSGRVSQQIKPISEAQKLRLASKILFYNIGHGSINAENVSDSGELIDLGHVTSGYPFMSFQYRCTLCQGIDGNRSDGSMMGILDFLFPPLQSTYSTLRNPAMTRELNPSQLESLFANINQNLNANASFHIQTTAEAIALVDLLNEKFQIQRDLSSYAESLSSYYGSIDGFRILQTLPVGTPLSVRFIFQIAAVKKFYPHLISWDEMLPIIHSMLGQSAVITGLPKTLETAILVIERNLPDTIDEKALFQEFLPASVVLKNISIIEKSNPEIEQLAYALKSNFPQLLRPIMDSPSQWLDLLKTSFRRNR